MGKFTTRVTEALGIEHPIVQGGMAIVGVAELASAVSNAGGLGILTGLTHPTPDHLAAEIERCRSMTDKPFGVNLTVFPTTKSPDYAAYARAIVEGGVPIAETAGPGSKDVWPIFKEAGVVVIHKATSVRHSLSAERRGVDVISIDGFECAGHPGEDDVPGLVLIPCAADQLGLPLIASGGFADGRGLAAALSLGADGINMGTRFCATREAPIHPDLKQVYLDADELGTNLIFRSLHNTARVGKSDVSDEVVRRLNEQGASFRDVAELVAGTSGAEVIHTGDLSRGIYWASLAQGLIHDIPTVAELIDRIVTDADEIITKRLAGLRS
ncbi:MAG TPA: nitronate monooxygenase family protein [Acidimicrobiales bacterium]|jgi:nitronate monooxygenase|nr:nitronate monooxygenase family protein [Acidimicrobiales bacterium]